MSCLTKCTAILLVAFPLILRDTSHAGDPKQQPGPFPVVAVTSGPKHHFFGYYDKCPWNKSEKLLLSNEVDFIGRQPKKGELLTVGMIDLENGNKFIPLGKTAAWGWQQGCMLQWLGSDTEHSVIYNTFKDGQYKSIIKNVATGAERILPMPIYDPSRDGKQAVTLDFARLERLRPGYGYIAMDDTSKNDPAPKDRGIWWMDLKTGKTKLVVTLDQLARNRPKKNFENAHHWVNHLLFNPSGSRFIFLHRWGVPGKGWQTRLYTAKPDGTDLRLVIDTGMVSHFDWMDDDTILAWTQTAKGERAFFLIDDKSGEMTKFGGEILDRDGHCSYSPDRNWVLNDTYPDRQRNQTLMLIRLSDMKRFDLGKFFLPPELRGPFRCDLHPRWNRDGTKVCFDSAHEPTRQLYVIDVRKLTKK